MSGRSKLMTHSKTDSEGPARAEDAQASIRIGIARARRLAEESKRLLERLSYGRLGPKAERPAARVPASAGPGGERF